MEGSPMKKVLCAGLRTVRTERPRLARYGKPFDQFQANDAACRHGRSSRWGGVTPGGTTTAVIGLIGFPLLNPTWVFVK
jgi:hypothetical protein